MNTTSTINIEVLNVCQADVRDPAPEMLNQTNVKIAPQSVLAKFEPLKLKGVKLHGNVLNVANERISVSSRPLPQ